MRRITISVPEAVPEALIAALQGEAKRRRASVSQIAREAIEARLAEPGQKRVIPFAGIIHSGVGDISANFDEYLAATWADDIAEDMVSDAGP